VTESERPLHAVVVAYHAPEELDECLRALEGELGVTVVDNSSSPAVREVARRRRADYVDAGWNSGFAAGANLALARLAGGGPADVLLLNPDAVLTPDNLRALGAFLHRPGNGRLAAVSPRLVDPKGSEQRVAWPFPSPARAWLEALGLGRLPARRTYAIGAVLALRWEALREVGLFDERFFLYAEEADWQRRASALGWSSGVCAGAFASHVGAGTSSDPRRREVLFHAAHETYVRKWFGASGWLVYRSAACLGATARALVLGGERRAEAARRARLYLRGPRRCAAAVRD
jgi:GT2 family glycosyltransferase